MPRPCTPPPLPGACFNLMGLLAVSWWKQQTMAQMFRGQSMVTYLLIANNACQVC